MARTLTAVMFQHAVHDGEIQCKGCEEPVDLSDADTLNEGVEMWNDHIREEHREGMVHSNE